MFLLVAHFRAEPAAESTARSAADSAPGTGSVDAVARQALALLVRDRGCLRLDYARSTEDPLRFVLVAVFASATAYRRALSPFDARTVLVPWLATAEQSISGVSEVLVTGEAGNLQDHVPTVEPP